MAKQARSKTAVTSAIGLLALAVGLLIWFGGAIFNNTALNTATFAIGATLAVIGLVVALVGFALRMLRTNDAT